MAPTSQKAGERPISFYLTDASGAATSISLVLRPEDLTRAEPSRLNVQQTLGGAWADNFGPGISTINISGHTGWRGGYSLDGQALFSQLRDTVFTQWHAKRAAAVANGTSPDDVRLIFADSLDQISVRVAPGQFVLKRNRARPLLMMYQFNMTVLGDDVAPPATEADGVPSDPFFSGLDSLADSLRRGEDFLGQAQGVIQSNFIGPVTGILNVANTAMGKVLNILGGADRVIIGQASQLVSFAGDINMAARNAFYTYNAIVGQGAIASMAVSEVASAFDNAFCVLRNVFRVANLYPDYSDVYGSSNCSSTSGGDPLSPLRLQNAFESIVPIQTSPVAVSPAAQSAISRLRAADPVLAPMTTTDLGNAMSDIGNGVMFA